MNKKNKNFVKRNICPYCTYPCDSAIVTLDDRMKEGDRPKPGALSFCLMCCQPSVWNIKMDLEKFDLNSIPDLLERNRIKIIGIKMEQFWEKNPNADRDKRREKYLKIMDRQ